LIPPAILVSILVLSVAWMPVALASDTSGVPGIVINEIMPDPDSDWDGDGSYSSSGDEWVELFNPGDVSLDLEGWSLKDGGSTRRTLPAGWVIDAGGFVVIYGSDLGSLSLNNGGDTVSLLEPDGNTVADCITYDSSTDDVSLGRLPDGSGPWEYNRLPTPGAPNHRVPELVINELCPGSYGWLELMNTGNGSVENTGLFLSNGSLVVPLPPVCLDPGGWITTNLSELSGMDLANTGLLVLLDSDGATEIDRFEWAAAEMPTFFGLFGRRPDGSGNVMPLALPTPGSSNDPTGQIVINEVMPDPKHDWDGDGNASAKDDEWAELYNPNPYPVDISGLMVADSGSNARSIPGNTSMAPLSHRVFFASELGPLGLNNNGDTVRLLSADGMEELDRLSYFRSTDDLSWGRVPDGSPNVTEFNGPTPGSTNGDLPRVMVNEFLYNPAGDDLDGEWVELVCLDHWANLTGWYLTDNDGHAFQFPTMNMMEDDLVVVHSGEEEDFEDSNGTKHLFMGMETSVWTNTGDDIVLMDRGGLVMDRVIYGNGTSVDLPNQTHGGGYVLALVDEGHSLARWGNEGSWKDQPPRNITPGLPNDHIFGIDMHIEDEGECIEADGPLILEMGQVRDMILHIRNTGAREDGFNISLGVDRQGWNVTPKNVHIKLESWEGSKLPFSICSPQGLDHGADACFDILVRGSSGQLEQYRIVPLHLVSHNVNVTWLKVNGQSGPMMLHEGAIVDVKGCVKNDGDLPMDDVEVTFSMASSAQNGTVKSIWHIRYDVLEPGSVRYPSATISTLGWSGEVSVRISVDSDKTVAESDPDDNSKQVTMTIRSTSPSSLERRIVIERVYANTRISYDLDEHVVIGNPTEQTVDISGWRITDGEGTVAFPPATTMAPGSELVISRNADLFISQGGYTPNFEMDNSRVDVPDMVVEGSVPKLANDGDEVMLLTSHNHTIDVFCFGDSAFWGTGWDGPPVPPLPVGKVFSRSGEADTNRSQDWMSWPPEGFGQSHFAPDTFRVSGGIIAFCSPDNSWDVVVDFINRTCHTLDVNIYHFTSTGLASAIEKALDRGVDVRVFLEGGKVDDDERYVLSRLHSKGARIRFMANDGIDGIHNRYTYDHAKYAVSDGNRTLLTSENWNGDGIPVPSCSGNRGWGIVVDDRSLARYFLDVFEEDWNVSRPDSVPFEPSHDRYGNPPVGYLPKEQENISWNANREGPLTIKDDAWITPILAPDTTFLKEGGILSMIQGARQTLDVQLMDCNIDWSNGMWEMPNLYLEALVNAASRGVKVRIMLDPAYVNITDNSSDNHDTMLWLRARAEQLDDPGNLQVRLMELDGLAKIHNKGVIADGNTVLVSSINWGYNSVVNNREAAVIVGSEEVGQYFSRIFQRDWESRYDLMVWTGNDNVSLGTEDDAMLELEVFNPTFDTWNTTVRWGVQGDPWAEDIGDIPPRSRRFFSKMVGKETCCMGSSIRVSAVVTVEGRPEIWDHSWDIQRRAPVKICRLFTPPDHGDRYPGFIVLGPVNGTAVNLSGWYLTDGFGRWIIPSNTETREDQNILVAEKGEDVLEWLGHHPGSALWAKIRAGKLRVVEPDVTGGGVWLDPRGGSVSLIARDRSDSDRVVWGDGTGNCENWTGPGLEITPTGHYSRILTLSGDMVDTDSAPDWKGERLSPHLSLLDRKVFERDMKGEAFLSPDSSYDVMSQVCQGAKETLLVATYHITSHSVGALLTDASSRGVDVRLLVEGDPVGGMSETEEYLIANLTRSGCRVRSIGSEYDRYDRYPFMHGKYLVADNQTVMVTSENLVGSGIPREGMSGNRGWGIRVNDPGVASYFAEIFISDWSPVGWDVEDILPEDGDCPLYPPIGSSTQGPVHPEGSYQFTGKTVITPVVLPDMACPSGSDRTDPLLEMIQEAEYTVRVQQHIMDVGWGYDESLNPYLDALVKAAERGVDVQILLDPTYVTNDDETWDNGDTLEWIVSKADEMGLQDNLRCRMMHVGPLGGGYELDKLHNKAMVVDGCRVLVSSINWDYTSCRLNRETGMIVENPHAAGYFQNVFDRDWNLSILDRIRSEALYTVEQTVKPGENASFHIRCTNLQNVSASARYTIRGIPDCWPKPVPVSLVDISPGGIMDLKMTVQVPKSAKTGEEYCLEVLVDQDEDSTVCLYLTLGIRSDGDILPSPTEEGNDTQSTRENPAPLIGPVSGLFFLFSIIITLAVVRDLRSKGIGTFERKSETGGSGRSTATGRKGAKRQGAATRKGDPTLKDATTRKGDTTLKDAIARKGDTTLNDTIARKGTTTRWGINDGKPACSGSGKKRKKVKIVPKTLK